MGAGAREFRVGAGLLLAVSYNQARWERQGGSRGIEGGYGLMNLTTGSFPAEYGRGNPAQPSPRSVTPARARDILGAAARLLHVPAVALKNSERQDIPGAAAGLGGYARQPGRGVPSALVGSPDGRV